MNHNLELRISLWIFGCCFIYEYWFLSAFDFVTLQWAHLLKMSVSYETGTLQRKTTSLHIHFQMNSLSLEQITAVSREKGEQAAKYRRVMDGVKMRWWWSMITRRASFAGAQGEKKSLMVQRAKVLLVFDQVLWLQRLGKALISLAPSSTRHRREQIHCFIRILPATLRSCVQYTADQSLNWKIIIGT